MKLTLQTKLNAAKDHVETTRPYQKLGTDITQFITPFGKLYLSPIIDFHTREILAFDISKIPDMKKIYRIMNDLIPDSIRTLEKEK